MKRLIFLLPLFIHSSCIKQANKESEIKAAVIVEAAWDKNTLSVCWLNDGYEFFKTMIENHITTEFHSQTAIRFRGWGKCKTANPSDVRLKIVDTIVDRGRYKPGIQGLANHGQYFGDGVWIHHENRAGAPTLQLAQNLFELPWNSTAYLNMAIHEFGHIIGLLHEDMMKKRSYECYKHLRDGGNLASVNRGTIELSVKKAGGTVTYVNEIWDSFSMMSYCRMSDQYKNLSTLKISKLDKEAIDFLYPEKVAYETPKWKMPSTSFDGGKLTRLAKDMIRAGSFIFDCRYLVGDRAKLGVSVTHNDQRVCGTTSDKLNAGAYDLPFIYTDLTEKLRTVP